MSRWGTLVKSLDPFKIGIVFSRKELLYMQFNKGSLFLSLTLLYVVEFVYKRSKFYHYIKKQVLII